MFKLLVFCCVLQNALGIKPCTYPKAVSLCANPFSKFQSCNVNTMVIDKRDCATVTFAGDDDSPKPKSDLGHIKLQPLTTERELFGLNISFTDVQFKKAYLKLSTYEATPTKCVCKMLTVGSDVSLIGAVFDDCFWNESRKFKGSFNFLLEYKAERNYNIDYRKFLFSTYCGAQRIGLPPTDSDEVRNIRRNFFYIDITDNPKVILKIHVDYRESQATHYKVEVFKDDYELLDVVRLPVEKDNGNEISLPYTFPEDGEYFFTITLMGDNCPKHKCEKTKTPRFFVPEEHSKEEAHLIIGIVGASMIIPLVLYAFYKCTNCTKTLPREKSSVALLDKIIMIYQPALEMHNEAITALARLITELTGTEVILDKDYKTVGQKMLHESFYNGNWVLASSIIYIAPPPHIETETELYTSIFLEKCLKKNPQGNRKLITIFFPYSKREVIPVFSDCPHYNLMNDLQKFTTEAFQNVVGVEECENNANYLELGKKIKLACEENERYDAKLPPKIVVTESEGPHQAEE